MQELHEYLFRKASVASSIVGTVRSIGKVGRADGDAHVGNPSSIVPSFAGNTCQ